MKTFKMPKNTATKLLVSVSSDAIAGSNVRLNGDIIKKSATNKFDVSIGNSNDLNNAKLSVWCNFEINSGNIDAIMNSTTVKCTLKSGEVLEVFEASKIKIDNDYFIALFAVELTL